MATKPTLRETEKFRRGRAGEHVVADLLKQRGWYIVPSYDYCGDDGNKAPKMEGLTAALILPDLDVARGGRRKWAEVKTKLRPDFTRITGRYEHGIPIRHFEHYRQVQAVTGAEVWLFIYEEEPAVVICQALDKLEPQSRFYRGPRMDRGGMVFWPRDAFLLFGRVNNLLGDAA